MSDTSNIKSLAISETGFVFDPRSGATYSLNPTGLALLRGIGDGASMESLIALLNDGFTSAREHAAADVKEFIQALKRHGLLSLDFKI